MLETFFVAYWMDAVIERYSLAEAEEIRGFVNARRDFRNRRHVVRVKRRYG
jgi:hypothetical protein